MGQLGEEDVHGMAQPGLAQCVFIFNVVEDKIERPCACGIHENDNSHNCETQYHDQKANFLKRGTNLLVQPAFSSIVSNLAGLVGTTSFTDTNATGTGPYFYRVGVQP